MGDAVTYRWDVVWGEVSPFVSRPICYISGYPPLEGETTDEYIKRVMPLLNERDKPLWDRVRGRLRAWKRHGFKARMFL